MANYDRIEAIVRIARADEHPVAGQKLIVVQKKLNKELEVSFERGWRVGFGRRHVYLVTLNRTIELRPMVFTIRLDDAFVELKLDGTAAIRDDEILLHRLGRFLGDATDVSGVVEAEIRAWSERHLLEKRGDIVPNFEVAAKRFAHELEQHAASSIGIQLVGQLSPAADVKSDRIEIDVRRISFVCSSVTTAFEASIRAELKYLDEGLVGHAKREQQINRFRSALEEEARVFLQSQRLHDILFSSDRVTAALIVKISDYARKSFFDVLSLRVDVDNQSLDLTVKECRAAIPYPIGDSQSIVDFDVRVQLQLVNADPYVGRGRPSLDSIVRNSFEQALSHCLFKRKRSEIAVDWSTKFSRDIEQQVVEFTEAYGYRAIAVVAEPNLSEQRFLRSFDIRVGGPEEDDRFALGEAGQFAKIDISFTAVFDQPLNDFTVRLIDQSKNPESEIETQIGLLIQKEAQRHLRSISPEEFHAGLRISFDEATDRAVESSLSSALNENIRNALVDTFGTLRVIGPITVSPHLTLDDQRLSRLVGSEAHRKVQIQLVGTDRPLVLVYDYGIRVVGTDLATGSWTRFRSCAIDSTETLLDHTDRMIKEIVQAKDDRVIFVNSDDHRSVRKLLHGYIFSQCKEQFGLGVDLTSLIRDWVAIEEFDKDDHTKDLEHEVLIRAHRRDAEIERLGRHKVRRDAEFDQYHRVLEAQTKRLESDIEDLMELDNNEVAALANGKRSKLIEQDPETTERDTASGPLSQWRNRRANERRQSADLDAVAELPNEHAEQGRISTTPNNGG